MRHRGSKPTVLTPALEARIMTWTRRPPPHGATHWSTRSLGRKLGVQHTIVARAWRHAGLQPHRLERYMRSTDPEFETKAADVIGLYLDPPQHAVVFCIDEKTAIQALDRLDPVLPLSPGRAERHGFEYYRHGTLSLYAALNTRTGEVVGHTAARHTSAEFVGFLQTVVETQPRRREMHIIVDNLSAHKTQQVRTFLVAWARRSEIRPFAARKSGHLRVEGRVAEAQGFGVRWEDAQGGPSTCYSSQGAGGRAISPSRGQRAGDRPRHGAQVPQRSDAAAKRDGATRAARLGEGRVAD